MTTNRDAASEFLESADAHAGDAKANDYSATSALIGIGYSLLEVADAIRDRTATQAPLPDIEALLMRVAAAADPGQAVHVAEHAAPEGAL